MDARFKILFSGEFKPWVKREEFVESFSSHLGTSREKAAALYELEHKVILKKNLSDVEAKRHMAAFEKMGMLVSKKLMMQPFVGPRIEQESRVEAGNGGEQLELHDSEEEEGFSFYPHVLEQGRRGWSSLIQKLKALRRREAD